MSDSLVMPGFEPEDLDGHTLDELADYLDRGRQPADPTIDGSPACRLALAALERLRGVADEFLDDDESPVLVEVDWVTAVLAAIPIETRAGRRFPIPTGDPLTDASVTEGAIKGLVRAIGDEIAGLLVGSVRIEDRHPVRIEIDVAVVLGTVIPRAVGELRRALLAELPDHVPFPVDRIDIRVQWLIDAAPDAGAQAR